MLLNDTIRELKNIMMSLTIKYKGKGEYLDTAEIRFNADRYISAMDKTDSFHSHTTYDVSAIINSGLAQTTLHASEYALNPGTIPPMYRASVLEAQRKYIIDNYIEMNPYYRVLNGKHFLGTNQHFASMSFYTEYGIPFKPVDEMTKGEVLHLESSGELQTLKEAYPEEKYLHNLGPYSISVYSARKAYNLQILKSHYTENSVIIDKFLTIYEQNRSYIMSVVYVQDFSNNKPYYDEFMALLLAVMTTQRVVVDIFKTGIGRDFYDISMIQALLESYNVPFIQELPLDYQNLLAKNLNTLLHYKSTDKVVIDILDMLGYENAEVMKYYLVKNHKLDESGKPVFDYITDDEGNTVENHSAMYDVHYVAVDIKEENEEFELSNSKNRVSYTEVSINDPYWWGDDSEVLKRLYEDEFNYVNTKYMHINIMYKLTEMMFETIHIFKILRDKKSQTNTVDISVPKILSSRKIDLFTFFVFLSSVLCKRNHLKGEIITEPSQVLGFFGFDFKTDFASIRDYVSGHEGRIESDSILSYIANMEVVTLNDIDRIFSNIRGLWNLLTKEMSRTNDKDVYNIYQKLYNTIFVSDSMTEVFVKNDGSVATTYLDMLKDIDQELYLLVETADEDMMDGYINHSIEILDDLVSSADHIRLIIGNPTVLLDALLKMLRFFKSYTVDIRNFNIIYVLDHPYIHGIKIMEHIKSLEAESIVPDNLTLTHYANMVSSLTRHEYIKYNEYMTMQGTMMLHTKVMMSYKMSSSTDISITDAFKLLDSLGVSSNIDVETKTKIIDVVESIISEIHLGHDSLYDVQEYIASILDHTDSYTLEDDIVISSDLSMSTKIVLGNLVSILQRIDVNSKWNLKHTFQYIISSIYADEISVYDTANIVSVLDRITSITTHDRQTIISEMERFLKVRINSRVMQAVEANSSNDISVYDLLISVAEMNGSMTILTSENLRHVSQILLRTDIRMFESAKMYQEVSVDVLSKILTMDTIPSHSEVSRKDVLDIKDALIIVRESDTETF